MKEREVFDIDVFAVFVWGLTDLWLSLTVPDLMVVDYGFKVWRRGVWEYVGVGEDRGAVAGRKAEEREGIEKLMGEDDGTRRGKSKLSEETLWNIDLEN
jgi:hypothetical protein